MSDQAPLLAEPCPDCGLPRTAVRAGGTDRITCLCCGGGGLEPDRACPHRGKERPDAG